MFIFFFYGKLKIYVTTTYMKSSAEKRKMVLDFNCNTRGWMNQDQDIHHNNLIMKRPNHNQKG